MRSRSAVILLTVACAVLTVLACSAEGAQIRTGQLPGVPVLSGDGALWAEGAPQGGIGILSGAPRRGPKLVQVFRPDRPAAGQYLGVTLAASDEIALANTYAFTDNGRLGTMPDYTELNLGAPSGPLGPVARCAGEDVALRSIDAWHSAYAWRQCGERGHVEIGDASAAPISPDRSVGEGGFGVRIAGRYVAWLNGTDYTGSGPSNETDIVVYDRVSGVEVYRVPRAALPGPVQSLDVQEDGKIAVAYQVDEQTRRLAVGWASPDAPAVHRLPLAAKTSYDVHIADDTIAFQRGAVHNDAVVQRAEVGVSDLKGKARIVGRRTDDSLFQESFDFDGQRLLWRELGCERPRLVILAASAAAPSVRSHPCPLRLLSAPALRRDAITLRLGCGAFVRPCGFTVRLRTTGRHGAPAGRSVINDGNPVRVPLARAARNALAKRGVLRLAIEAALVDSAGRRQTRRTTVTVRR